MMRYRNALRIADLSIAVGVGMLAAMAVACLARIVYLLACGL